MPKTIYHICNEATPQINGGVNIYEISSIPKSLDNEQGIFFVNVHLNWEGRSLSKNYGFDIANELRTKLKSTAPIILYSPIKAEFFEQKSQNEIKYKILFGRGSAFLEAPFKESDLSKLAEIIEPLSNAALHDVATMLCDLKGIVIDKLNHDLKFSADIDKIIGSITPYLSEYQKKKIKLAEFCGNIKKVKIQDDFNALKLQFITLCNHELTEKGKEKPLERNTKPHKVLVLDDLQEELNRAKENLKAQFAVEEAVTGEQAIDILKKDVENEIVAVIADWRLFTNAKQTYWQSLQGYEVLNFAATNGIRSLFALTSQADFVVHHLRNLMGIRFSMFKKENLITTDQWKVFADVLFEACEEAELIRTSIPDSDNWKKNDRAIDGDEEKRINKYTPGRNIFTKYSKGSEVTYVSYTSLHEQYLAYRHSHDRETLFRKVDEKADEVWENLTALYKNNIEYKGVEILRNRFDIETPKDSLLFPVLVLRRIWMALWYKHVDDSEKLSQSLITEHSKFIFGIIHNEGNPSFEGNKQAAEQTKLCISIPQVRNKIMLPEERVWLIKWKLLYADK